MSTRILKAGCTITMALFLGLTQGAAADQPGVVGESQESEGVRGIGHKGVGVSGTSDMWHGVYGESQEAEGVRGVGHKGAGVSGTSENWHGVYGESQEVEGVRGVGHKGAGVSGSSKQWLGVFGATESPQAAGGKFQNTGGGDLLRAGQNGAFRVLNNGDVLVRGQIIGATGAQGATGAPGAQGPKGDPGSPGPAVRTVAVCADATPLGNPTCSCSNRTVTRTAGACTVTSDTGPCSASQNGCCAVCVP